MNCKCGRPIERVVTRTENGMEDVVDLEVGPGSSGTVVEYPIADGQRVFGVKHTGRRIHACAPKESKR